MIDASPAILSIAMLAILALAAGGARLVAKRRDRTRGVLMLVAAAVLFGNVLIWAWPAHAETPLPRDVAAFVDRRDSCDHRLGEEPDDRARRRAMGCLLRDRCRGSIAS